MHRLPETKEEDLLPEGCQQAIDGSGKGARRIRGERQDTGGIRFISGKRGRSGMMHVTQGSIGRGER